MSTLMEVLKSQLAPLFTAAIVVLLGPIVKDHIPAAVRDYLFSIYEDYFFPQLTMIIEGSDDLGQNQIHEAAITYLRNKVSVLPKPRLFKCRKAIKREKLFFDIAGEGSIIDNFRGIRLEWKFGGKNGPLARDRITDNKCFELSFDKRSEEEVLEFYIPHLLARAEDIRKEEQEVKLYSRGHDTLWKSRLLEHPATFERLAMDPELQSRLKDDLDRFVHRKDWYKKVGRAWKRGYLIYGPPGTGKSSLIAAMANFLKYDIYDLGISGIESDSELRDILLSTSNRSIMIIEDIDCARLEKRGQAHGDIFLHKKKFKVSMQTKFTLSGLLNVIDGLWSSCGDERIFVFTTNRKDDLDRLDPALFRPGRMDMHVPMSYCTMYGFKKLASTYLDFNDDHQLYVQIEQLLGKLEVTPAEIAEELSRTEDPDVAFCSVVEYLEKKKDEEKKRNEEKQNELVRAISV